MTGAETTRDSPPNAVAPLPARRAWSPPRPSFPEGGAADPRARGDMSGWYAALSRARPRQAARRVAGAPLSARGAAHTRGKVRGVLRRPALPALQTREVPARVGKGGDFRSPAVPALRAGMSWAPARPTRVTRARDPARSPRVADRRAAGRATLGPRADLGVERDPRGVEPPLLLAPLLYLDVTAVPARVPAGPLEDTKGPLAVPSRCRAGCHARGSSWMSSSSTGCYCQVRGHWSLAEGASIRGLESTFSSRSGNRSLRPRPCVTGDHLSESRYFTSFHVECVVEYPRWGHFDDLAGVGPRGPSPPTSPPQPRPFLPDRRTPCALGDR